MYNQAYYEKNRERISLQHKHYRRTNVAPTILVDTRRADKKAGRENDLDLPFIEELLSKPCFYCGERATTL